MTLRRNQVALALGTLYETSALEQSKPDSITPNIWINTGSVDLYVSNSATRPTSLADMTLNETETNVEGSAGFKLVTRWLALEQNTGTTTDIVVTGLTAQSNGAIA